MGLLLPTVIKITIVILRSNRNRLTKSPINGKSRVSKDAESNFKVCGSLALFEFWNQIVQYLPQR